MLLKFEKVFKDLKDFEKLWSEFGLWFLFKSDLIYKKYNIEYDVFYWRGVVWININFLVVRVLNYYVNVLGFY